MFVLTVSFFVEDYLLKIEEKTAQD